MYENLKRMRKLAGLTESMELKNVKLEAPRHKTWTDEQGPIPFSAILVKDGKPIGQAQLLVTADAHLNAYHHEMIDVTDVRITVNGKNVDSKQVDVPLVTIKSELLDVIGDPYDWPKPDNRPPVGTLDDYDDSERF